MTKKICIKCNIEKDLLKFNKDKSSKDGHFDYCKECRSDYRKVNKHKHKEYLKNNKDKIQGQQKEYNQINKESRKEYHTKYMREKSYIDPLFKLKKNIGSMFRNSFRRNGFSKNQRTGVILGCSFKEFKAHIESQFESWMNWDNHGKYNGQPNNGWDIDHIIPLCIAKTEDELLKLNHYSNLQPLCSKINRDIKKGRV